MNILFVSDFLEKLWWAEKVFWQTYDIAESQWYGVYVYGSSHTSIKNNRFSLFDIRHGRNIRKLIIKKSIDIVHIHKMHQQVWQAFLMFIPKHVKVIRHVHDFTLYCPYLWVRYDDTACDWKNHKKCKRFVEHKYDYPYYLNNLLRLYIKRFLVKRYVNVYLSPSIKLKEYLIDIGIPKKKITVLNNFVKLDQENIERNSSSLEHFFVYVWRLSVEKWIDKVIDAFARIKLLKTKTNIKLYIIWEWNQENNLKKQVKLLKLDNYIIFLWKLPFNDIVPYYKNSLAVILPSNWLENCPMVWVEALSFWASLIATDIWWLSDFVDHGYNGYLCELWNINDLTEKLELMINLSMNTLIEMRKFSYAKFVKDYTYQDFCQKIISIYQNNFNEQA